MRIFAEEGVDPATVQIAHTGDTDDLDYIEELLATGCYIGMDRYGLDLILPTERRNATVIELCKRGHAERMMISQDACATIDWIPADVRAQAVPNWHFTYIFEEILPAIREAGVSDEQVATMMEDNPQRWLSA